MSISVQGLSQEIVEAQIPLLDGFMREVANSQMRFNGAKMNETVDISLIGFEHRILEPVLREGVNGVLSRIFPELEFTSILFDCTWLIKSELIGFLDEPRSWMAIATLEIMRLFSEPERMRCPLKQDKNRDLQDYPSQIKSHDIIREASKTRREPSHWGIMVGESIPTHKITRESADPWERRSGGKAGLRAFGNLRGHPIMKKVCILLTRIFLSLKLSTNME
jgi:hypothetical protein